MFRSNTPTIFQYGTTFGFNTGLAGSQDNYGVKAYTYFVPPTSGAYKFWIRSDDGMQLYMNTNANGTQTVYQTSANSPAGQRAIFAADGLASTKYLNFDELNCGLTLTPLAGATTVTGLRFITGGDAPERDPMTYTIEGTTGSATGGLDIDCHECNSGHDSTTGARGNNPRRYLCQRNCLHQLSHYFPHGWNAATANSMQISEVTLLVGASPVPVHNMALIAENTANNANYSVGTTPANSRTNITLVGGQRYYIEAYLKEGTGGDGFSVA